MSEEKKWKNNNNHINNKIQSNYLFGRPKYQDPVKKYLKTDAIKQTEVIEGEEKVIRIGAGSVIITRETIGMEIANNFNHKQKHNIKSRIFEHKILCESKNEPAAIIFVSLRDMVGELYEDDKYKDLSQKEICDLIQTNLCSIIENEVPWILGYSKHIIRDYYNIMINKVKVKLNFILDNGDYENNNGLLINGILEELEYYENNCSFNEDIGILCQVLIPSGLPKSKKWTQIDIGITISGKRNYKESIKEALVRETNEQLHIKINDKILDRSAKGYPLNNKLFYGGLDNGEGYEGYEVHLWEIFYFDQYEIIKEQINNNFCKCHERQKIINDFRNMSIKNHNKNLNKNDNKK